MTSDTALPPEVYEAIADATSLDELHAVMERSEFLGIKALSNGREIYCDGDLQSRVMLIVEEPQAGQVGAPPVTGESGMMLDAMLASIGLSRADLHTALLSPWPTPGGRALTESEIAAALPFMRRRISLCGPDFLIFLGGNVARALTGSDASGFDLRKGWLEYDDGEIILPAKMLYHPGFLMKEVLQKEYAWADLIEIRRVVDGGDPFQEWSPAS